MNESQTIVRRSLLIFCWCLIAFSAIAWGASFIGANILHMGYPYNTFLFDPAARFSDITDLYEKIQNLDLGGQMLGAGTTIINYPAPALYVYAFFICLFPNPILALIAFTAGSALGALLLLRSKLTMPGADTRLIDCTLILTALCSYPFLMLLDRANLEAVVWFFSLLGLLCFAGKRYLISALFFAATVCIKPFPILFFFLFLPLRRYKEVAAGVLAICVTNLVALWAVGPTVAVAFRGLQPGVRTYFYTYVVAFRNREETFDHSAFSCVKQLIGFLIGPRSQFVPYKPLMTAYTIWAPLCVLILLASGVYFWRKPRLNQIFAIVLLMLLLPPISGDYTLTELYLPWGVFLIFLIRDVRTGKVKFSLRDSLWILIPCAILVTPQSYLTFWGGGFAGQLKALVLTLLLFVVARIDMPSSLFGELPASDVAANASANALPL